jgi:Ni/Fe-hydrogenase subunit HybB-like protein
MGFSMTIYMDIRRNYELLTIYIYNNLIIVITRTKIILYIMVYELKKLKRRTSLLNKNCLKFRLKIVQINNWFQLCI